MYNWSTDEALFGEDSESHELWQLEQKVNFGLQGEKLSASLLKKYWDRLQLDPRRRRFLGLLLYGTTKGYSE